MNENGSAVAAALSATSFSTVVQRWRLASIEPTVKASGSKAIFGEHGFAVVLVSKMANYSQQYNSSNLFLE